MGAIDTADATLVVETDQTIRGDESRLRQLVENELWNAIDHCSDDVTITVGDLDDGFYIADDGPGIPAGERDRVFESGYSTLNEGMGFGLTIVLEIAEAHDWEIRVTDSDTGGTRGGWKSRFGHRATGSNDSRKANPVTRPRVSIKVL